MDTKEAIDALGIIIENGLVRNLKLIMEGSYGILSNASKEKEISRFKSQVLRKKYFKLVSTFSDAELNTIIDYILLRNEIRVNERNLNKPPEELDEMQK